MTDKVKVRSYKVESYTRKAPKGRKAKTPKKATKPSSKSTAPFKFPATKKYEGRIFKLATLHKGVTKAVAMRSKEINKKEGNKWRMESNGDKYALYIRKGDPINSKYWADWAIDEFKELKNKHGAAKAKQIFYKKYGDNL